MESIADIFLDVDKLADLKRTLDVQIEQDSESNKTMLSLFNTYQAKISVMKEELFVLSSPTPLPTPYIKRMDQAQINDVTASLCYLSTLYNNCKALELIISSESKDVFNIRDLQQFFHEIDYLSNRKTFLEKLDLVLDQASASNAPETSNTSSDATSVATLDASHVKEPQSSSALVSQKLLIVAQDKISNALNKFLASLKIDPISLYKLAEVKDRPAFFNALLPKEDTMLTLKALISDYLERFPCNPSRITKPSSALTSASSTFANLPAVIKILLTHRKPLLVSSFTSLSMHFTQDGDKSKALSYFLRTHGVHCSFSNLELLTYGDGVIASTDFQHGLVLYHPKTVDQGSLMPSTTNNGEVSNLASSLAAGCATENQPYQNLSLVREASSIVLRRRSSVYGVKLNISSPPLRIPIFTNMALAFEELLKSEIRLGAHVVPDNVLLSLYLEDLLGPLINIYAKTLDSIITSARRIVQDGSLDLKDRTVRLHKVISMVDHFLTSMSMPSFSKALPEAHVQRLSFMKKTSAHGLKLSLREFLTTIYNNSKFSDKPSIHEQTIIAVNFFEDLQPYRKTLTHVYESIGDLFQSLLDPVLDFLQKNTEHLRGTCALFPIIFTINNYTYLEENLMYSTFSDDIVDWMDTHITKKLKMSIKMLISTFQHLKNQLNPHMFSGSDPKKEICEQGLRSLTEFRSQLQTISKELAETQATINHDDAFLELTRHLIGPLDPEEGPDTSSLSYSYLQFTNAYKKYVLMALSQKGAMSKDAREVFLSPTSLLPKVEFQARLVALLEGIMPPTIPSEIRAAIKSSLR